MGYDAPTPGYQRQPGSFDPRAAFIFEGVGADEVIGDFGLALGGAAGDEMDRLDFGLGSPPHTLLLATASGYSDYYVPVVEDHNETVRRSSSSSSCALVRADMVYFETEQRRRRVFDAARSPGAAACPTTAMTTTSPASPRTC